MVTAETAVTIPVVILVFALMVSALSVVLAQGTACHAARVVAREVSLGKSASQAIEVSSGAIPTAGTVKVSQDAEWARIVVSNQIANPFKFQTRCEVVTRVEPKIP